MKKKRTKKKEQKINRQTNKKYHTVGIVPKIQSTNRRNS
jgi:hypothetical protein